MAGGHHVQKPMQRAVLMGKENGAIASLDEYYKWSKPQAFEDTRRRVGASASLTPRGMLHVLRRTTRAKHTSWSWVPSL
jgi:hypothetical protein